MYPLKQKQTSAVKSGFTQIHYRFLIWIGFISFLSACAVGGIERNNPIIKIPKKSDVEILRINLIHGRAEYLFGLNVGISNEVRSNLTGIQIGILNKANNGTIPIQIGVYNRLDGVGYAIRMGVMNSGGRFSMLNPEKNMPIYLLGGFTIGALNVESDGGFNIGIANIFSGGVNVGLFNLFVQGINIGFFNDAFGTSLNIGILNYCEFGPLPVMILANYCFLSRD
ncbi:hypothetical protein CH380_14405 [Leptospira adleri]|uniref:Lipoprotein n=2 Tax=Leptospira adleri TaxID=2023186 RepID=A0A2M9YMG7_9LEPT|nr:hypothetical protein CH380_14405 [Leptospira adleri]PJZ59548.1 hypothetical protein CH376_23170 [Leptospira adleri]